MGRTSIVNDVSAPVANGVTIEKWVYGGEALARLDGRVVLAPFVLPGETVRLDVDEGIHAGLAEVLTPSPDRVAPPCPLFTRCGGCHYQHAPYEFQLARKVEILREQLRRVGKIEYTGDIDTISGPPLAYPIAPSSISRTEPSAIEPHAPTRSSQSPANAPSPRRA